jgi:hypothetical protein
MDLVSAIIGLAVLALFSLPFILSGKERKKIEKRLLSELQAYAAKQQTTVTEHDFGSRFAIGLSSDNQYLFLIKANDEGNDAAGFHLSLQQIQNCRSNTVTHSIPMGKSKETVIDRLELVFQPKDPKAREQTWVLYDTNANLQLNNEIELMRKWEKRLNIVLRESRTTKAVA